MSCLGISVDLLDLASLSWPKCLWNWLLSYKLSYLIQCAPRVSTHNIRDFYPIGIHSLLLAVSRPSSHKTDGFNPQVNKQWLIHVINDGHTAVWYFIIFQLYFIWNPDTELLCMVNLICVSRPWNLIMYNSIYGYECQEIKLKIDRNEEMY